MTATDPPKRTNESAALQCTNCGSPAVGRFCSECGQSTEKLGQSLGAFASEAISDFLSFDSRFWRTIKPLLGKPGQLTASYLEGHRARYVPPLRLFLFASFVAFLVLGLLWAASGPAGGPLTITLPEDGARELTAQEKALVDAKLATYSAPTRWLVRNALIPVLEDPARAQAETARRLPIAILYLVPMFAVATRLLFRKQELYFVPHLVFSLHVHTFGLIAVMVGKTIDWLSGSPIGIYAMAFATLAYVFVAARRVFANGLLLTALKITLLVIAYLPTLGIVILVVAAVAGTSFAR